MATQKEQLEQLKEENAEKDTKIQQLTEALALLQDELDEVKLTEPKTGKSERHEGDLYQDVVSAYQARDDRKKSLVESLIAAQMSAKPLPTTQVPNNPYIAEMVKVAQHTADLLYGD